MTEIVPARRLLTYNDLVSRLKAKPCAPRPVPMKPTTFIDFGSMIETPFVA